VLTDSDFGQYYLRGRSIPDFIYDASRLYSIVLLGYSANDPPMKYLLSAVSADFGRFSDIKPRYIFLGSETYDSVEHAYWKGRGIQPIHYYAHGSDHSALERTFAQWALFAPTSIKRVEYFAKELLRIVKKRPNESSESDRERFELIFDLSPNPLRENLMAIIGKTRANLEWLDIAIGSNSETKKGKR
jgi:hypothetical protein